MYIVKAPFGAACVGEGGGGHAVYKSLAWILKHGVFIMQQRLEHSPLTMQNSLTNVQ